PHVASGEVGYHVLDVMLSAEESAASGEFVTVESSVSEVPLVPVDFDPLERTIWSSASPDRTHGLVARPAWWRARPGGAPGLSPAPGIAGLGRPLAHACRTITSSGARRAGSAIAELPARPTPPDVTRPGDRAHLPASRQAGGGVPRPDAPQIRPDARARRVPGCSGRGRVLSPCPGGAGPRSSRPRACGTGHRARG